MFHVNLVVNLIWSVLSTFAELTPPLFSAAQKFLFGRSKSQSESYAGKVVYEVEAEEGMEAKSLQGTEVEYQGVTTEEPEKGAVAPEQMTELIGAQEVQIAPQSSSETESEEDLEQVFDVESGKTMDQEGSEREVVFRYWKKWTRS